MACKNVQKYSSRMFMFSRITVSPVATLVTQWICLVPLPRGDYQEVLGAKDHFCAEVPEVN